MDSTPQHLQESNLSNSSSTSSLQKIIQDPLQKFIQDLEEKDLKVMNLDFTLGDKKFETMEKRTYMRGVNDALKKNDGLLIIDGGTILAMQQLGADLRSLNGELWQTYFLKNDPALIQRVHKGFFESGADIGITATYVSRIKNPQLLQKGAELIDNARREVQTTNPDRDLLIAASCGPYGSGAQTALEYDGSYGKSLTAEFLEESHRQRFEEFVDNTDSDIIAFETIPCLEEVQGILNLLKTRPHSKAWICVSCKDDVSLCSGESLIDFIKMVEDQDTAGQVEALGVNCTPPQFTTSQIQTMRTITQRTIVVYPNSGGKYEPKTKKWISEDGFSTPEGFAKQAIEWKKIGGSIIIGGCCRTSFKWIEALSQTLRPNLKNTIQ